MILYHMDNVNTMTYKQSYDVMICANGLEGRDTSVAKKCKEKGISIKNWLVFHYKEREVESEIDEGDVLQYLKGDKVRNIMTSYSDPRSYAEILENEYEMLKNSDNIGIDITGFKNQFFFPLIKFLYCKMEIFRMDVFYTEPAAYKFPKSRVGISYFPNMRNNTNTLFN